MKNILDCLVRSIPLSIINIGIGYFIVFILLKNQQRLELTLFILGAIPIICFLPSVFIQSHSGALHTPKVIFRKVDTLERNESKGPENMFPALSYILAGVLTWLFSLVIH